MVKNAHMFFILQASYLRISSIKFYENKKLHNRFLICDSLKSRTKFSDQILYLSIYVICHIYELGFIINFIFNFLVFMTFLCLQKSIKIYKFAYEYFNYYCLSKQMTSNFQKYLYLYLF